jgi:hypothetical protein
MDDQDAGWASLGNGLLTAGIAHGWTFVVGVLSILLITNLTAYLLVTAMIKNRGGEVKIKTPFLAITVKPKRPEEKSSDAERSDLTLLGLSNLPSQEPDHSTLN